MKGKFILSLIFFVALLVLPTSGFCWVDPVSGQPSIQMIDAFLPTPLGSLALSRSYHSNVTEGILGPGWTLDIVSRLDQLSERDLRITQAGQASLLSREKEDRPFEGAGGVRAQRNGEQWVVKSTSSNITSLYDGQGREISRSDANGNTLTFTYDSKGLPSRIQALPGHALTIIYGPNGLLSAIQDHTGRKSTYRYDETQRLIETQNADGWKTAYQYNDHGMLIQTHYPSGEKVSLQYDDKGRVIRHASSTGLVFDYSFQPVFRISRNDGYWAETRFNDRRLPLILRDRLKRERYWSYDEMGRLVGQTFFDGSSATYVYDSQDRIIKQETSRGDYLTIGYDGESSRPTEIDLNGAITRFTYDKAGNTLSAISPAGRKTTFQYDQQGRNISVTDGEGRKTRFEYDSLGNMVKQTNPDNSVISWLYSRSGQVAKQIDPSGNVTSYAYQSNGLLASITDPGGESISYQYDSQGQLIEEVLGNQSTRYAYSQEGHLVRIDYPDKTCEQMSYDILGNPVRFTDTIGRVFRQEFDSLGRIVKTVSPSGLVMANAFDPAGKLALITLGRNKLRMATEDGGKVLRLTDPNGGVTWLIRDRWGRLIQRGLPGGGQQKMQYDPDGFLQAVTQPMGDNWAFRHNGAGQLQEVTFPDGRKRKLTYDAAGRINSIQYPSGEKVSYRYGPAGLLSEHTNARGQKIKYHFNRNGKLIRKQTPEEDWNYRYDTQGNLVQAGNEKFTVRYAYDPVGRLTQTEYLPWGKVVKYEYDKFGRVIGRTDPDEKQTRYTYDHLGRVTRVKAQGANAFTFIYDDAGRLLKREAANGTSLTYTYDDTGREVAIVHKDPAGKVLASASYRYDADGNRVEVVDQDGHKRFYRYDLDQRLIAETGPSDRRAYVYGPGGRRSSLIDPSGTTVYRYKPDGTLAQMGNEPFSYDDDGNLVSRSSKNGATRYSYDSDNNLKKVELPDQRIVVYGYGPFGERIWREENGQRIYYLLDGDHLLQELSSEYSPLSTYVYAGLDKPLMVFSKDGAARFFHQDDLGSILAISDENGTVTATYAYDAFGNAIKQEGKDADQPLRFTGRPLDSTTGLYDLRARFYDPETGTFISRDRKFGRIDDPVTLSTYQYAFNNPLKYVDPFGRSGIGTVNIHNALYFGKTPVRVPGMDTADEWYTGIADEIWKNYQRGIRVKSPPGVQPQSIPASGLQGTQSEPSGEVPVAGGQTAINPQQAGAGIESAPSGVGGTKASPPQNLPGQPGGMGWWQGLHQRGQGVGQRLQSEWHVWQEKGPSAQALGLAAGAFNLMMAGADIVAEPIAASYHGENATEEMDKAAQELKHLAVRTAEVALVCIAVNTVIAATAPAAVPAVVTSLAAASVLNLAWGAGNRIGTAFYEGTAALRASAEADRSEEKAAIKDSQIKNRYERLHDLLEEKVSKLEKLKSRAQEAPNIITSLELEAADKRNAIQVAVDKINKIKVRIKDDGETLLGIQRIAQPTVNMQEFELDALNQEFVKEVQELSRRTCELRQQIENAGAPEEQKRLLEELKRSATGCTTKARELEARLAGQTVSDQVMSSIQEVLTRAQGYEAEVEWQLTSLTSSERGIRERINVIEGYWEAFEQAWKLKSEIKAHLGQLQHFEDPKGYFNVLGRRAASVDLQPKEDVYQAVVSARAVPGIATSQQSHAEEVRKETDDLSIAAKELLDNMTRYNGQVKSAINGVTHADQQAQTCASYQLGADETAPEKETDGNGEKEQAEVKGFISLEDETQPGIQRTATGDEAEVGGFEIISEETIPPLGQHKEPFVVEEKDSGGFESLGAETQPVTDERQAFDKAKDQDQGGFRSQGDGEFLRREGSSSPARPFSISGNGPSAFHIFATGSRMGWGGGLARYSVGPADQSIIHHLSAAGAHTKAAYDTSFEPTRAWPNWRSIQGNFQSWGQQLARSQGTSYRRQLASTLEGGYGPMAEQLGFQTVGETQRTANCDANYCRIGYLMAYGQQALMVAEGASSVGDTSLRDKAQQDGIAHLSQAIKVLGDIDKVTLASGYCVDLRDVRQQLVSILHGGSLPDRVRKATNAWETALERIRNQQSPPSPVTQTASSPLGSKTDKKADNVEQKASRPPQEEDTGDLLGDWAYSTCNIIMRFSKKQNDYIGTWHQVGDWAKKDYKRSDVFFRLQRTGANVYEGIYIKKGQHHQIKIIVAGKYLRDIFPGLFYMIRLPWIGPGDCNNWNRKECNNPFLAQGYYTVVLPIKYNDGTYRSTRFWGGCAEVQYESRYECWMVGYRRGEDEKAYFIFERDYPSAKATELIKSSGFEPVFGPLPMSSCAAFIERGELQAGPKGEKATGKPTGEGKLELLGK